MSAFRGIGRCILLLSVFAVCIWNGSKSPLAGVISPEKFRPTNDFSIIHILDLSPTVENRISSINVVLHIVRGPDFGFNCDTTEFTGTQDLSIVDAFFGRECARDGALCRYERQRTRCIEYMRVCVTDIEVIDVHGPELTRYMGVDFQEHLANDYARSKGRYQCVMGYIKSALEVDRVLLSAFPQPDSSEPQAHGRGGQYASEHDKDQIKDGDRIALRALPEGFLWVCLSLFGAVFGSGLIVVLIMDWKMRYFQPGNDRDDRSRNG